MRSMKAVLGIMLVAFLTLSPVVYATNGELIGLTNWPDHSQPTQLHINVHVRKNNGMQVRNAKIFVFDEKGNLLNSVKANGLAAHTSLDIPVSAVAKANPAVIDNYAIRVISSEGIGVKWVNSRDLASGKMKDVVVNVHPRPQRGSNDYSVSVEEPGLGFIVKRGTYDLGAEWTIVGELHAVDKSYALWKQSSSSSFGIESKGRYEGSSDWSIECGYIYKKFNSTLEESPVHKTPGGIYVTTEVIYKMDVWDEYDGDGNLVSSWEEIRADSIYGGIQFQTQSDIPGSDSLAGDMADFNEVEAGLHGSRKIYNGGCTVTEYYTETHSYGLVAQIGTASLGGVTAYSSGHEVNWGLYSWGSQKEDSHARYAIYSKVGGPYDGIFPVHYVTYTDTP